MKFTRGGILYTQAGSTTCLSIHSNITRRAETQEHRDGSGVNQEQKQTTTAPNDREVTSVRLYKRHKIKIM